MNKVVLMGRLTADPELRQTQSGIASCRFTIAINRKYKNQQTGEYDADFISCVTWRQTAEFVSRYFSKGSMIAVEGSLRSESYQDKKHPDVTHYSTVVLVENVEFTGEKKQQGTASNYQPAYQQQTQQNYRQTQQNYGQQPTAQNLVNSAQAAGVDTGLSYNTFNDFEEILSDGDVPF